MRQKSPLVSDFVNVIKYDEKSVSTDGITEPDSKGFGSMRCFGQSGEGHARYGLFRALFSLVLSVAPATASDVAAEEQNPFDPSGYIKETESKKTAKDQLISKSIFRIDGKRFQKFDSHNGSVFVQSLGDKPDFNARALCPRHLPLMTEVLPVREDLRIGDDEKSVEKRILTLIRECREGRIKSPVKRIEKPDGATVEITVPDPESRSMGVQLKGTKKEDAP